MPTKPFRALVQLHHGGRTLQIPPESTPTRGQPPELFEPVECKLQLGSLDAPSNASLECRNVRVLGRRCRNRRGSALQQDASKLACASRIQLKRDSSNEKQVSCGHRERAWLEVKRF